MFPTFKLLLITSSPSIGSSGILRIALVWNTPIISLRPNFVQCLLALLVLNLTSFSHATEDFEVPTDDERRMGTVVVTASRTNNSSFNYGSILNVGSSSPIMFGKNWGDEYYINLSCRRNVDSIFCSNICQVIQGSAECEAWREKNNEPDPPEPIKILDPIRVTDRSKEDDRSTLNFLIRNRESVLRLSPVRVTEKCETTTSNARVMRFPKGTYKAYNIVLDSYYTIRFRESKLYKLVREVADELALAGKDGVAVDWRNKQEAGLYLYWNFKTGNFRVGQTTYGALGTASVRIEYRNDKQTSDEVMIGVLHTQPKTTYPSYHDIEVTRFFADERISSPYLKDFIVTVKVDNFGNEYVKIKMFDLISIPISNNEVDNSVRIEEKRNYYPDYPYSLFDKYSLSIEKNGNKETPKYSENNCKNEI